MRALRHFRGLAAALVTMAVVMGCAGPQQASQPAVQQQTAAVTQSAAAPSAGPDELDVAIRDASDYLNDNIPKGSKIVILNVQSNSSDLSDYIIDELIANAVNDKVFTVVDRQQLEAIRAEQKFQSSGAVDDNDAVTIGKFLGAKTIVSGAVSRLGATGYRIRIRALEVQTAQVQGQFNRNIAESKTVNSLMESGSSASGGTAATEQQTQGAKPAQQVAKGVDFRDDKVGIDMVFVQGGTFKMGCTEEQSDCENDESPVHNVTLSDFYIMKYEITQKQWVQVMGTNPSHAQGDDIPVGNVSWNEIRDFITELNIMTSKKYRLPTEAEWEYAARGGNKSKGYKYSGSSVVDKVAWYSGNRGIRWQPVGTKQPNELGIHDMSGHVFEWVSDWYGEYPSSAQTNPTGPSSGSGRVFRGGRWDYDTRNCRVSIRGYNSPDFRHGILGFRLAVSP